MVNTLSRTLARLRRLDRHSIDRFSRRLFRRVYGDDYPRLDGRCRQSPEWLVLGVNNVCNLHCKMCDVGLGESGTAFWANLIGQNPHNMTLELLREILRQALESLREGWRFLRSRPVILGTFVLDTNAMVFGMPQALFPAIAVHHFDAGARVVGVLYGAPSAGALLAALTSGWIAHVRRQGVAVAVAIVVWGAAIAAFGFATALWFGVAMLALAGLADEFSAILRSTILFAGTPDPMRGRMQGFELAQVASTPALGNVEAGIVASLTSLRFSVVSGGIACAAGAVAILAVMPTLFRYDSKSLVPVSGTAQRRVTDP